MKRRSFLHKLSHAAAAPIVLPNLLHQALAQQSGSFLSNTNEPGRILVLIKLDGGNDGLDVIKKVIYKSTKVLKLNGILALEIGYGQYRSVKNLLKVNNFKEKLVIKDYENNIRCIFSTLLKK